MHVRRHGHVVVKHMWLDEWGRGQDGVSHGAQLRARVAAAAVQIEERAQLA